MDQKPPADQPPQRRKNGKHAKTLGPVQNFEEHVPPDWWRKIFNAYYLKTDADVVDDDSITRQETDLFTTILALTPDDAILDLCCGQGRHTRELARRGFKRVEGLDCSPYLIQKAKEYRRAEGLCVKFREGDARKLPYPSASFDVSMILGNSFGYFRTPHEDLQVLREAFRVLKPGGRLLVDVADGEYLRKHFQPRSWEWINKKQFVCRERALSLDGERLISREIISHVEKGVIQDQFYAERLYTRESLTQSMIAAGFTHITFHGELIPDSQRNQDLGMMAKRIIVTGVKGIVAKAIPG